MKTCVPSFHGRKILLSVFTLLLCLRAFPVDLLVYNNNDSGPGSLRQAIQDNDGFGGGNRIVFSNTVTGAITLTSSELLITNTITIVGPGPGVLAISGNGTRRVLHLINVTNPPWVLISGLTIRQGAVSGSFPGNVGGAIWNERSTLTLRNCVIRDNKGGGGAGGAIFNDGSYGTALLFLESSTVSNNSTTNQGGAIWNYGYQGSGSVSAFSSTLSSNNAYSSTSVGGAIFNDGTGGNATAGFSQCTLSGNTAGQSGGAIYNGTGSGTSSMSIAYCTVSDNSAFAGGGSVFHNGAGGSATLYVAGTLFKAGASGGNLVINGGSVVNYGYNLSSDGGGGLLTNVTDQINTDPLLGPLVDNGGPTLTHALLPGSPAIDKGYSFGQAMDQRGEPRVFDFTSITNLALPGDGSDIGAFEVGRPKLRVQKSGSDAVLSWAAYSAEFALQSSTNAASPGSWITAGGAAGLAGGEYRQTNGPISSNRFFRLKRN